MGNKEQNLIDYYYMGVELATDNKDFPKWFEHNHEKIACLHGYNDFTLNTVKTDKEEILKEVSKMFGN